jgi:hypothetical protein
MYLIGGKAIKKETTKRIEKRGWVDNNKMDLRETGWGGLDWIGLLQDRELWRALANAVMDPWAT